MAVLPGELRASEAAHALGVHYDTVRRWAHAAEDPERPAGPLLPGEVRRDLTRHILIRATAVERLSASLAHDI